MSRRLVYSLSFAFSLTACATRQTPRLVADAQSPAKLDAAYSCVVNTIENAGYPVVAKDGHHFSVRGQIRQELPPGEAQARGGVVGGAGSDPKDLRDPPAPYEVDAVGAIVSLDPATGAVRIETDAYTGIGSTAHSGYVKRWASTRGAATVKKMEVCSS